jgi:cell division protein FtsB
MDLRVKGMGKLRILPSSEEGVRAVMQRAPQAEAFVAKLALTCRPISLWISSTWRRLATAAVVLLTVWLSLHVMLGANGMVIYRQKRAEYQQLQKENQKLQMENEQHTEQIKALRSDPQTIEKEAREQLHYTRPGEVVYVSPPAETSQKPASHAARR